MKSSKRSSLAILGITLAVASSVGAFLFLTSSQETESFLVTESDVASGTPINELATREVQLNLAGISDAYLRPGQEPPTGYLLAPLRAGQLIPKSAVAASVGVEYSNLVISPSLSLSSQIAPGRMVAIWSAPKLDYDNYGEPTLLAVDVEVVAVIEPKSNFVGAMPQVELRIPKVNLPFLLRAIANSDSIALTSTSDYKF